MSRDIVGNPTGARLFTIKVNGPKNRPGHMDVVDNYSLDAWFAVLQTMH